MDFQQKKKRHVSCNLCAITNLTVNKKYSPRALKRNHCKDVFQDLEQKAIRVNCSWVCTSKVVPLSLSNFFH